MSTKPFPPCSDERQRVESHAPGERLKSARGRSPLRFRFQVGAMLAGMLAAAACTAAAPAPALPPVPRATLLWTQGNLMDAQTATATHLNFVHTFPRPPKMRGLIPVPAQREWLEKWAQQVRALHAAGIFVSASVGSTCFNPEIFRQNGLDPEIYFARDENDQPSSMLNGAYGKELMSSCYSNPHWIARLTENVLAFARAGFDGMWYDVGGYVDAAVLYCHCTHCRDGWRRHLTALGRDPATPLPKRTPAPDYTRWQEREFLRWRWAAWQRWSAQVRDAVQREYPRFAFSHNMGVREGNDRGMHMFLHATTDLFDYVHWEEWGHGTAPYSDLTSYLLGAAVGRGKPVMLVQNDKPARNPLQHRAFLAEGYASGGVPQFGVKHHANSRAFLAFVQSHEPLYQGGRSMANVAVVYSAWSQALRAFPAKRWPSHWMGQLLLDRHVPFDYVVAERDFTAAALSRYKAVILPDVACLTDAQLAVVRDYVHAGGHVLATGGTARFDENLNPRAEPLAKLLGADSGDAAGRLNIGRGKLALFADSPEEAFWRRNPRDFAKADTLPRPTPLPDDVAQTFDWIFGDTLPVQAKAPPTTVVLPRRHEHELLLHLVNYDLYPDGKELHAANDIELGVALPTGSRVSKIEVLSPDSDAPQVVDGRSRRDGRLWFTVPELNSYSVVVVHLAP